jgi:hypothetical protein
MQCCFLLPSFFNRSFTNIYKILSVQLFSFFFAKHEVSDNTAGINRLNTAFQAVLAQPCSTGGWTGTFQPKREPTGQKDLSDRSRLVLCNQSQELIGQACPTHRQVLCLDSACPTTGRTWLFEHHSNCRVRPFNAGSVN